MRNQSSILRHDFQEPWPLFRRLDQTASQGHIVTVVASGLSFQQPALAEALNKLCSCVWANRMCVCVSKLCASKLCVRKLCVCGEVVCGKVVWGGDGGRRRRRRRPGAHNQKTRLPRKVKVDVAKSHACHAKTKADVTKCHACHANRRGDNGAKQEPSALPEPAQRHNCHACHAK